MYFVGVLPPSLKMCKNSAYFVIMSNFALGCDAKLLLNAKCAANLRLRATALNWPKPISSFVMFQLEHDHDQTVPTSPGVVKQVGLVAFETTTTEIQNFRADLFEDHPSEGNETLKARSFHKRNEILYSFLNVLAYLKKNQNISELLVT